MPPYQQQEAALHAMLTPANLQGRLPGYIQAWKNADELLKFTQRIGAANFLTLVGDYYGDKLRNIYEALPLAARNAGMVLLAGLGAISRGRIHDMYPHVDWKAGGYLVNSMAQAAILEALQFTTAFAAHQSGPNIPLNANTGLLGDITRANQLYTVLVPVNGVNVGQKNYIFNANGICIAEVDFGNHGGDAVSGHCHPFGLPGCVAFAHHNAGGVHVSMAEYPVHWRALPMRVQPQTPLGT